MLMRQPFSYTIRRNFLPGIHVELKQSPHQRSLRAQLYWLQVTLTNTDLLLVECHTRVIFGSGSVTMYKIIVRLLFQVDNQVAGAIFPTVFHPVPLPKSIVQDSGINTNYTSNTAYKLLHIYVSWIKNLPFLYLEPKPFIDVSIITRFNEHSQVLQFK